MMFNGSQLVTDLESPHLENVASMQARDEGAGVGGGLVVKSRHVPPEKFTACRTHQCKHSLLQQAPIVILDLRESDIAIDVQQHSSPDRGIPHVCEFRIK